MKIRFCAALLLAALALPLFGGCAANATQLDRAEDLVENRLDRAEDALESRVEAALAAPAGSAAPATEPAAPTAPAVPATEAATPAATEADLLTKEEAEKIALEHAGFTADQVTRLRTELDHERGRPEYEVDFHVDRYEYDYEIDAKTGKILSWDKDRDD